MLVANHKYIFIIGHKYIIMIHSLTKICILAGILVSGNSCQLFLKNIKYNLAKVCKLTSVLSLVYDKIFLENIHSKIYGILKC